VHRGIGTVVILARPVALAKKRKKDPPGIERKWEDDPAGQKGLAGQRRPGEMERCPLQQGSRKSEGTGPSVERGSPLKGRCPNPRLSLSSDAKLPERAPGEKLIRRRA
jgi:hypothetical protein